MPITIATWNVNSVRLRLPGVAALAEAHAPDVICLQEVKVAPELFPIEAVKALGYPYLRLESQKGYNGVAILSRLPLAPIESRQWCTRNDCRHIGALLPDGTAIHNFYVPAGGDIPDPDENPKFAHKLDFLSEMAAWSEELGSDNRSIVVGDLNVAPLETDVWSHKQLLNVVSHTPVEVAAFERVVAAGSWEDAVRAFIPPEERLYTWWSYRARDWSASDRGRRLDHIWVSPSLRDQLRSASVLRSARGWEPPSDHVPVLASLEI
ncbi:MAG: exodeoxyribonuclease III [Rhodospirillaceae bacterium]|nr:exodeoxyribonuclease III [Rhodospirillaceae bacterium]